MANKWIKPAIKKPGSLRATAKRAGKLNDGIDSSWLESASKKKGITGQRARLAKTLKKLKK